MITTFGGESFAATAFVQVVAAADFDRSVIVHEYTNSSTVVASLVSTPGLGFVIGPDDYISFTLPADEELWLASGTASVLVTK